MRIVKYDYIPSASFAVPSFCGLCLPDSVIQAGLPDCVIQAGLPDCVIQAGLPDCVIPVRMARPGGQAGVKPKHSAPKAL